MVPGLQSRVRFNNPDPLDPVKRFHDGILIKRDPKADKGTLFHVTGDMIAAGGMSYGEKLGWVPGQSAKLHALTPISYVLKADYNSGRTSAVLRSLPTPSKQQGINSWEKDPDTGRYELIWTKQNDEPYAPGEQRRPIFKCNEWTAQYAIPALRNAGILRGSV